MRKLLAFLSVFLLLNSSFGQDIGATFLQAPSTFTSVCPNAAQTIDVVITNFDAISDFDFSVNNVRVTVNITGASTQTITQDITFGVISNGGTYLVSFASTCDLSVIGTHVFTYSTSILTGPPDINPANDLGGPVNVRVKIPTLSLSSAVGTDAQSVCAGVPITDITYSVSGSATDASNIGDAFPTGVSGSYLGGVYTISGTPTQSGTFNYEILTSGGSCLPQVSLTGVLTVTDAPTSDAGLDATICLGDNFTASATATNGSILWTSTGDGLFDDDTAEDPIYTPGAGDIIAGTVDLTMTVSSAPCADAIDIVTVTINGTPPSSDAGLDAVICEGDAYTLVATAANGSILWTTSGDGLFDDDTAEDPIYTPGAGDIAAGTVDLTMTVSSAPCLDAVDVMTLTIDGAPLSDAGIDATICNGDSYTAIATATNAGSILWSTPGDGAFDDNTLEDATYTPGAGDIIAGTVDLTMTVSNGVCVDAIDLMTITINNTPPTSDAGLDASVCEGDTYTLVATAANGTILWTSSGDGLFDDDTAEDPIYTPGAGDIAAGTVDLTMTVSSAPCSDAVDVMTLTIDGAPLSDAGIDAAICTGDSYTAIATATNAGSILWSTPGDGAFDDNTLEDATYTPGAGDIIAGTVDLTMTVSNGVCVDAIDLMTITINLLPTSDAGLDASVCEGDTYTLVATAANGTILWTSSGDGLFDDNTAEDPIYTPGALDIAAGTVDLTMTVSSAPCSDAVDVMTLTIDGAPLSDAGIDATVCEGDSYTAIATATNAGSILWSTLGDGAFDDNTLEDATYTPGAGDIIAGTVDLTMTVSNGVCVDATDIMTLSINSLPIYTISKTDPTACGAPDGSITISVLNITTDYDVTYNYNAAPVVNPTDLTDGSGVLTISGLTAGSYTNFIVTETIPGCSTPDLAGITLSNPGAPDVDDLLDQTLCDSDGGYILPAITGVNLTGSEAYYTLTGGPLGGGVVIPVGTNINTTSTIFIYDELGACNDEENFTITINATPTSLAGIAADDLCEGTTYTTSLASSSNGTILWTTSGDGTFDDATLQATTYTPGATDIINGTVTLTQTVSNAPCLDAVDNIILTIHPAPTADAGLATDIICETDTYTLSATATNGTIAWLTSGDGLFNDNTLEDPVYTPGAGDILAGTVTLTMEVSNAFCSTASDNVVLTINLAPTSLAGVAADDMCEGTTYTTSLASSSNGTILWTTSGDGTFDDATLQATTYTPGATDIINGTVTLTQTVSNAPCLDAVDNIILTIHPAPTADAGLATDIICETDTYTLSATATNGTIAWLTSGDGLFNDNTLEDPVYTPGAGDILAGTVTLTMEVSNAFCFTASDNVVLTINLAPTSLAGVAADDMCEGTTYTTSLASSSNGTILWTTSGDGSFDDATLQATTYTPGATDIINGTVTLTQTVSNTPCLDAVDNIILTIHSAPTADAGLANDNICDGNTYTASATSTNGSVLWTTSGTGTFTNATIEDAIYTPSLVDAAAGVVTLTMTVSNAFCNDAIDNLVLTIDPLPSFTVNVTSHPSACGFSDGVITLSGLTPLSNYDISYDDNGVTIPLGIVATDGSGDYPINGLGAGSFTNFIVISSLTSCTAIDVAGNNLLVPGSPDVDDIADQILCDVDGGFTLPVITGTNLTAPGYYSAPNGGGVNYLVGDIINTTSLIYIYDINGGGCFDQENFTVTINSSPTADAGLATDDICETDTYTLSATATNGTIAWTSSGDGIFDDNTLEDPTYTPGAGDILAGTVTLTMTVSNAPCVDATDNIVLTINASPTAVITLATNVICETDTYLLDAASTNGTNLWTSSGDGIFDDNTLEDPTYTPGVGDILVGTVDLTMTVSNAFCVDATDLISLTINAAPTADAGLATDDICETDTYTLAATATNGTIAWTSSGDGTFDDNTLEDPTYTPGAGDILAGTVTLTMTVSNAPCADATDNIVLTINAAPIADAGALSDVICENDSYLLIATAVNGTISWSSSGDGIFDDNTLEDPTYTPGVGDILAGTVDLTMTVSNAFCVDAVDLITISITPLPVIADFTGATTICSGVVFNDAPVDGVNGVVPATTDYTWLAPSGLDLPAGITGELPGSAQADINGTLSNSTNGTLAVTYTVTPSNLGCVGTDFRYTVNVYPETTIALTAGSLAQAVCNGNSFIQNDYTLGGTATGVSMTSGSLPSGLIGTFNAGVYSITGNPTQSGAFPFELTTTGSSCAEAAPLLDTIYVLQDTIYLSSASYTNDQQVCLGNAIDQIEYTTSTGATGVIVNGLPSGYITNFDPLTGLFTLDWTPGVTEAGTYIYNLTTTGPCSGAYLQGSITVNTTIDHLSNTAGSAISICEGSSTTLIGGTVTGGNVTKTYLWESSLTAGGPFTNASGINSTADYITDNLLVDTYYRRTVTSGGCSDVSDEVLVTVVPRPVINLTSSSYTNDQSVCLGNSIDQIEYTVSGGASGLTVNGLPTGYVTNYDVLTGVFTIDWTPGVTEAGTYIYTVSTTGACTGDELSGKLTINTPIDHLSNTAGSAISICEGSNTTLLGGLVSGGDVNKTYLWESSLTAGGPYTNASGINSTADYVTDNLLVDTYFRRTVSSGGCTDISEEVLVTVEPKPIITVVGGAATICYSETHTVSGVTATNEDVATYSWIHNGAGALANATTLTPTYTPTVNDAEKTITLTLTLNGQNSCGTYSTSADYFVTINPVPTAFISDLTGDVCANDSITVPGASATNGSILWTHNGNGTLTNSTTVAPTYTPGTGDAGSLVILTMTVSSTIACVPPVAPSINFIVNVKPLPTLALNAGVDDTLSLGSSVELSPTGSGVVTWEWFPITGLDNPFIMNPIASPDVTTTYELTGTDINGCRSTDSVSIVVENDFTLEISNLMTPNGDGKNDTWGIGNLEFYPNTKVIIVNRDGQILFEDDNYLNTWDGTYDGKLLPDATYYYIITSATSSKVYKGSITLLSGSSK